MLAELAAEVVTIERVLELATRAEAALAESGSSGSRCGSGTARSGAGTIALRRDRRRRRGARDPPALYEQLSVGGRLVLPRGSRWGQELVLVSKSPDGPVERASVPCRFVPLVGAEGFGRG